MSELTTTTPAPQAAGSPIKRVVVVLLDGRSFDNVLGFAYRRTEKPAKVVGALGRATDVPFCGVDCQLPDSCDNKPGARHGNYVTPYGETRDSRFHPSENILPAKGSAGEVRYRLSLPRGKLCGSHYPGVGAAMMLDSRDYTPLFGKTRADESEKAVKLRTCQHLLDPAAIAARKGTTPCMRSFAENWSMANPSRIRDDYHDYMRCHSGKTAPVLNGLAREYACSDDYFASVPSDAWPNLMYLLYSDSFGVIGCQGFHEAIKAVSLMHEAAHQRANVRPFLEEIRARVRPDYSWSLFTAGDTQNGVAEKILTGLGIPAAAGRSNPAGAASQSTLPLQAFHALAGEGALPDFSLVELGTGDDIRGASGTLMPLTDIENELLNIYHDLFVRPSSQYGEETLLIITALDGGGMYEHIPPPAAPPQQPAARPQEDDALYNKTGLDFTILGPRVPFVAVSPYIARSTLVRRPAPNMPLSHSSIGRTVMQLAGLPERESALTSRDHGTGAFMHAFAFDAPARTDAASVHQKLRAECDNLIRLQTAGPQPVQTAGSQPAAGGFANPSHLAVLSMRQLDLSMAQMAASIEKEAAGDRAKRSALVQRHVANFVAAHTRFENIRGFMDACVNAGYISDRGKLTMMIEETLEFMRCTFSDVVQPALLSEFVRRWSDFRAAILTSADAKTLSAAFSTHWGLVREAVYHFAVFDQPRSGAELARCWSEWRKSHGPAQSPEAEQIATVAGFFDYLDGFVPPVRCYVDIQQLLYKETTLYVMLVNIQRDRLIQNAVTILAQEQHVKERN